MLNIFRIAGDLVHCLSIYLLINKIHTSKSVNGLSFKTQLVYLIVYLTRYVDLFMGSWHSYYNSILKIVYIGTSGYICYLMQNKYRNTLNPQLDTFKIRYLFGAAAVLALLFHLKFTIHELFWSFSIWLEAGAILPQLFMIQRTGKCETMNTHYIFALGAYRALYVLNWAYRWIANDPADWISVVAGLLQTVLYSDFFYVYYTKVVHGESFTLPT